MVHDPAGLMFVLAFFALLAAYALMVRFAQEHPGGLRAALCSLARRLHDAPYLVVLAAQVVVLFFVLAGWLTWWWVGARLSPRRVS